MIRFIDLGKQYWGENESMLPDFFAFIDTTIDKFVELNGSQFWECWDSFMEDFNANKGYKNISIGKFASLVDKKFFRPPSPLLAGKNE